MKLSKHIFLMLGMASVFSLYQFDANAKACNKKTIDAGKWCKDGGGEFDCRAGCYCVGTNNKDGISVWTMVDTACKNQDASKAAELNAAGVYYCGAGKNSGPRAKSASDCYDVTTAGDDSNNCTSAPEIGKYCKKKGSQPYCEKGCYCPGGNKNAVGDNDDFVRQVTSRCRDHSTANDAENYLKARGIYYCPADFPESDLGTSLYKACYFKDTKNNKKVYADVMVEILPGQYLPKQTKTPAACPSDKYCPGGTYAPSAAQTVGDYDCPGTISANKTTCTVICKPGNYVPSMKTECKSCANLGDDKYCPDTLTLTLSGGKLHRGDMGIQTCPSGQKANSAHTACESTSSGGGNNGGSGVNTDNDDTDLSITVAAGKYLPANSTSVATCYGVKRFCPGGIFQKASVDQGIYDCPFNGVATNDKKACNLQLTSEQMLNGISGNGKCWLKTSYDDFMTCIYGVKMINVSNASSNGSGNLELIRNAEQVVNKPSSSKNLDVTNLKSGGNVSGGSVPQKADTSLRKNSNATATFTAFEK